MVRKILCVIASLFSPFPAIPNVRITFATDLRTANVRAARRSFSTLRSPEICESANACERNANARCERRPLQSHLSAQSENELFSSILH